MTHETNKPADSTPEMQTLNEADLDEVAGGGKKIVSAFGSWVHDDKPLTPKQQEAEDGALHFFSPITGIVSFVKSKLD